MNYAPFGGYSLTRQKATVSNPFKQQTHQGTIDLTNMKSGTYFLKLQAGERSVVRKVVKY